MREVFERMSHPTTGVEVRNRRWLLRTYDRCFVGSELVDWLIHNQLVQTRKVRGSSLTHSLTRLSLARDGHLTRRNLVNEYQDAVALGNMYLQKHYLHHVTRDHTFKDENLYYRFVVRLVIERERERELSVIARTRHLPIKMFTIAT